MKQFINLFIIFNIVIIGCKRLIADDSEKQMLSEKEIHPITVRIAVNETIEHTFFDKRRVAEHPLYRKNLPIIPLDFEDISLRAYFDVVITNITSKTVKIPRFYTSSLTLKLIDANGKKYLLSAKPPYAGGMARSFDAHVLKSGSSLVHRVYMDWYKFPKIILGQKVKLQAIYKASEIIKNLRIKLDASKLAITKRKLELTKDLKLWHGEVYSPLREFLLK